MLRLIAFDYGATSGRGIAAEFDGNRLILGEEHRFENRPVFIGESFYWDFPSLLQELKNGIKNLSKQQNPDCIGVDTWGVDYGLLDASGELLGIPYHYRDARTDQTMESVFSIVPKKELYQHTGIQMMPFNTIFQLAQHLKDRPWMLEKASDLLFMPDLFNYFLTGERATESTIASTGAMVDPKSGRWTQDILKVLGIPTAMLGDIVSPGCILGSLKSNVASELGVAPFDIAVVAGHDTGSAVAAVPAATENYAYLSCGTWSLMGIETKEPIISEDTYGLNFTNEGGVDGTFRVLKNINGLWIQSECQRAWKSQNRISDIKVLDKMALSAQPFRSFIDPDEEVFMKPGNMPEKIANYCRDTAQPVPGNEGEYMRCLTESLAMKYRYTLESIERFSNKKIDVLHMVGGGCQNRNLCAFTASAVNRLVVAGPTEGTALGNLMCQLIAKGECSNLYEARQVLLNTVHTTQYEPWHASGWNDAYEKFLKVTGLIK